MKNKFIKTKCGLDKYHQLSKNKTFFGKLRLILFVMIASLRDINKKNI